MTTDLLDGRWPISLTADSQFLEVAAFVSPLTASRLRRGGAGEERGWEGGGDRPHTVAAKVTTDLSDWLTADFRDRPTNNSRLIENR